MNEELRYLDSLQGSGIRPGLGRMRRFLRAAGHPERAFPSVLVAGTNGKGSTAATLASILHRSGYRTGLYVSPHLVSIRERWILDGAMVPAGQLRETIRELRRLGRVCGVTPTYFEALTLLAFLLFRDSGREVAVLEVGMGGRLDATNVVDPLAALITPIGLDHTEWLGPTIGEIAREKAGIIHPGTIAVTALQDRAASSAIRKASRAARVALHEMAKEVVIGSPRAGAEGVSFTFSSEGGRARIRSPLSGAHQIGNVALAVRAAELLAPALPRISRSAIAAGAELTRWRGRLERFDLGDSTVWVDGAHNAHALAQIAPWIRKHVPAPRTLVFGVLKEKDFEEMAGIVVPLFDAVIVTEPSSERAVPAREAALRLEARFGPTVRAVPNPRRAVRAAVAAGGPVVVTGSLYLAGDAIAVLDSIRSSRS